MLMEGSRAVSDIGIDRQGEEASAAGARAAHMMPHSTAFVYPPDSYAFGTYRTIAAIGRRSGIRDCSSTYTEPRCISVCSAA
jgi:hypothetical protein